jgi:predicted molibdopterin-dependent oxidoreductase YjgC
MATPISGGTAFDFGAAAQAVAVQPQTTTVSASQPTKIETTGGDTVKLSDGAQVRLMSSQGETVAEIVINTALSTQAVNSYLGISRTPALPAAASNK